MSPGGRTLARREAVIHHRAMGDLPGGDIAITPRETWRAALVTGCAAVALGATRADLAEVLDALGLERDEIASGRPPR